MLKPGEEDFEDPKDPDAEGQDVDVEDDADTTPLAGGKEFDPEDDDKADEEFKKFDNKAFAAMRIKNRELAKQVEEAKKEREELARLRAERQAAPVADEVQEQRVPRNRRVINGIPVPETEKEWDDLARRNWRTAVDLRSIVNAEQVNEQVYQQREAARVMEDSKQKVLSKHPELNDASTEKSQVYLQILRENPEYLRMAKGPMIAMREMEERMSEAGTLGDVSKAHADGARSEAARQQRVAVVASGGKVSGTPGAKTVTLTKDELEMCEHSGLDPKAYAKQKLAMANNKKGGF